MPEFSQFLQSVPTSANEPKVPSLIGDSFMSIGTPGMRVAPELLVLELMREVFYEKPVGKGGTTEMNPEQLRDVTNAELVSIEAARGRIRRAPNVTVRPYYMPLYPEQARNSPLRAKTDRVLRNNFLRGPLSQARVSRGEGNMRPILTSFVDALYGRARSEAGASAVDLMAAAMSAPQAELDKASFKGPTDALALLEATVSAGSPFKLPGGECDQLACRITDDLYSLCEIEGRVPRLLWLELLKTFLRISTAIWLLAQARLTVILRDEIRKVLQGNSVPSLQDIVQAIKSRGQALVRPLSTPSLGLHEHVINYGRARVELSLLIALLDRAGGLPRERELTLTGGGATELSVEDLLIAFQQARRGIEAEAAPDAFGTWLSRGCEMFPMWRRPDRHGQSKNLDEFLRVLYRFDIENNDDGFLARKVWGAGSALLVFPGQDATKLMAFLADRARQRDRGIGARRRLLLDDLERHFFEYGIDFGSIAGARPRLLEQLSRLGLLKGSPDAGNGAWLDTPLVINGRGAH